MFQLSTKTKWYEFALGFAFGAAIRVAGLIANKWVPESELVLGLSGDFPSQCDPS
jgi:hypothetical protein